MPENIERRLTQAAEAGEVLRIIYHRGSQPGTVREILPIRAADGMLQARAIGGRATKTFAIEALELVVGETDAPPYVVKKKRRAIRVGKTVGETIVQVQAELEATGLHVEILDDFVSLHDRYKNGKLRSKPVLMISYEPTIRTEVRDDDGNDRWIDKPAKMAYKVSGKALGAQRYGLLSKAAERFRDEAAKLAKAKAGN